MLSGKTDGGLDTTVKNKGTAGGEIWGEPLEEEAYSPSVLNLHAPAETGVKYLFFFFFKSNTKQFLLPYVHLAIC